MIINATNARSLFALGLAIAVGACGSAGATNNDNDDDAKASSPKADGGKAPTKDASGPGDGIDSGLPPDGGDGKTPRPSNGAAFGALPTSGAALELMDKAAFDTTTACTAGSILGECAPVIQAAGPAVCVCRSESLVVHDLKVTGVRGLALLVHGSVSISGTVDIAATNASGGAGAEPAPTSSLESGMFVHGTAELVPLRGGAAAIDGGGGGGALQISAGVAIVVAPSGTIQAGGGGGFGRFYAGTGGGSGGALLLEAPTVKLEGQLLANGGGGGGGGSRTAKGGDGLDARTAGRLSAAGGQGDDDHGCALSGRTSGGDGGFGGIAGVEATTGQPGDFRSCIPDVYLEAGGAGGGVGRIRVNAATAGAFQVSSTSFVSPKASIGQMTIE
jgi:hypothetical protein